MDAGNGTLARGVLHKLQRSYPDLFERCHYMIAERGPGQVAKQQQMLAGLPRVTWFEGSAADIPAEDVDFAFSNELLDVAPLHRPIMHAGVLRESYVGMDKYGAFIAVEDEISQAARDEIGELDTESIPDGIEITVSPMQTRWLRHMVEILRPGGNLMTIDYATKPLAEDPMSYVPRVYLA